MAVGFVMVLYEKVAVMFLTFPRPDFPYRLKNACPLAREVAVGEPENSAVIREAYPLPLATCIVMFVSVIHLIF